MSRLVQMGLCILCLQIELVWAQMKSFLKRWEAWAATVAVPEAVHWAIDNVTPSNCQGYINHAQIYGQIAVDRDVGLHQDGGSEDDEDFEDDDSGAFDLHHRAGAELST